MKLTEMKYFNISVVILLTSMITYTIFSVVNEFYSFFSDASIGSLEQALYFQFNALNLSITGLNLINGVWYTTPESTIFNDFSNFHNLLLLVVTCTITSICFRKYKHVFSRSHHAEYKALLNKLYIKFRSEFNTSIKIVSATSKPAVDTINKHTQNSLYFNTNIQKTNTHSEPAVETFEQDEDRISKCCKCDFENNSNSQFCSKCGSELKEIKISKCFKCKFDNKTENQFCSQCGSELGVNESTQNNEKNNSVFMWIFGIVVIVILIKSGEKESVPISKSLNIHQSVRVCKAYIGELFQKPISSISHYKTDTKGQTYVRYTRKSDNNKFSYVCSLNNSTITWATWLKDEQIWGRWRDEDTVQLSFNKVNNTMSFNAPDTFKEITVDLY